MSEAVERECGVPPDAVVADCGYYSLPQIQAVEARGVSVYVPDILAAPWPKEAGWRPNSPLERGAPAGPHNPVALAYAPISPSVPAR